MKVHSRAAGSVALLVMLLTAVLVSTGSSASLPLGTSPEIPAAQGKVNLHRTKNGNVEIKLRTVTAMSAFDLFITCEQSQTTACPSAPELLPLHYLGR